mmetsp:Transcript_63749/g.137137  ORF Transcript_63749/g.137137 Transcript_63749/m.137137 type:complete len:221 (+) Transcript_63749:2091-2753(+)
MPITKTAMLRPATTSMALANLSTKRENFKRHALEQDFDAFTSAGTSTAVAGDVATGTMEARSPTRGSEPGNPAKRAFLAAHFSRNANNGGRKRHARTQTDKTQRPMKRPNSRRGCKTLTMFAKKLAAVVKDVAKQFQPAFDKVQANLLFIFRPTTPQLWSQKSQNTNTTSLPMPAMRKRDRKDVIVVFSVGVNAYPSGTAQNIMMMEHPLMTTLRVCTHM